MDASAGSENVMVAFCEKGLGVIAKRRAPALSFPSDEAAFDC